MSKFNDYVSDFISLFYPRICVACGGSLYKGEEHLCLSCMLKLPLTNNYKYKDNSVEKRFYGKIDIKNAVSFLYYEKESITQRIMHEIKYHEGKMLGKKMGNLFGAQLKSSRFDDIDALIPVPLHPNKLKLRGYNQSEWIAIGMAEVMNKPVYTDVLKRVIENPTQTKKNVYERWENVKGIFSLSNSEKIRESHVLIVDDVLTTGSTIEACVHPLAEVENIRVSVAALAAVD